MEHVTESEGTIRAGFSWARDLIERRVLLCNIQVHIEECLLSEFSPHYYPDICLQLEAEDETK